MLKRVSERLTERLGKGWSEENLRLMRKFYILYSCVPLPNHKIQDSGLEISTSIKNADRRLANPTFKLPWSHYQILTHVKDPDACSFYEIEAYKQQWSTRQLQCQIGRGLYERLALSRDKDEVMCLATEGQVV